MSRQPGQPRVLTGEEFDALLAAFRDPEYRARLLADAKQAAVVEVDNPFRTELRPRRGTDEVTR